MFPPLLEFSSLPLDFPATASSGIRKKNRPIHIAKPMVRSYQGVLGVSPPNALPLLPVPLGMRTESR